jgi:hypothetical protein
MYNLGEMSHCGGTTGNPDYACVTGPTTSFRFIKKRTSTSLSQQCMFQHSIVIDNVPRRSFAINVSNISSC